MLKIRFFRIGKKNQPFFRIVVTEHTNPPRGGRFIDIVGFFNPQTKEKSLKADKINHWLKNGAEPSDRVHNLLVGEGIIKADKKPVHTKSKKKKDDDSAKTPETTEAPKQDKAAETPAPAEKPKAVKQEPIKEEPTEKPAEKLAEKPKEQPAPEKSDKPEKPNPETK